MVIGLNGDHVPKAIGIWKRKNRTGSSAITGYNAWIV